MRTIDRRILPVAIALMAATSATLACDTPVYRYAMYNWSPAPYQVFYLHAGEPPGEDRGVNQELSSHEPSAALANVAFWSIDAHEKEKFEQLPDPIKAAWNARPARRTALHVLASPRGTVLFAGQLDKASVATLFDSPLRTRIGELLQQGNAAILLTLDCPDRKRTQKAEQAVREAIAQVSAGKVGAAASTEASDSAASPASPGGSVDGPSPRANLKIASLTLSRSDKAEAWLVRAILRVESDLGKYADQPMVFAIYGRGQVLPPFVGKGIVVDNLLDCVAFLSGACSCQVKDENPGVELPMRWDWQATADALAADDKGFGDGVGGYREVAAGMAAENASPEPRMRAARNESGSGDTNLVAKGSPAGLPSSATAFVVQQPSSAVRRPPPTVVPSGSASFVAQQTWVYGVGVASATLVVLAAGLVLVRRKRSGHGAS